MTKDLLKDAIVAVSYKPGWDFAAETYCGLGGDEIIALNIKAQATCIDSGEPITIDRSFPVIGEISEFFKACGFIYKCIDEIEQHEIKEWLKFRGVRFFPDVHGEDGY